MVIREIIIFTEDAYGVEFFKKLILRLKKEGFVNPNIIVHTKRLAGKCHTKIGRQISASLMDYDRVLVVVDGEGHDIRKVEREEVLRHVEKHIARKTAHHSRKTLRKYLSEKLKVIVLDYMIEEWVCRGLGINFRTSPVRDLDIWLRKNKGLRHGYEKGMLPYFVFGERTFPMIDINSLINYPSFKNFLSALAE